MNILQINSYFFSSTVHKHLVQTLDQLGINQTTYIPLAKNEKKTVDLTLTNGNFVISNVYSSLDRVLYFSKLNKSYFPLKKILRNYPLTYDISHAHSLFVNGGLALKAYEDFKIPYVVAVRATDLHLFFKYFIHLRSFGIKILSHAKKIYVLNEGHKLQLISLLNSHSNSYEISKKIAIVANGIDSFWHNNYYLEPKSHTRLELLYVGQFIKRKNIFTVLNTFSELISRNEDMHLTLVGNGVLRNKILGFIQSKNLHNNISVVDWTNKDELINYYRNADIFINIAHRETFGLVFIEALTQNCFVIYSKGEGVDGLIPEKYGVGINATNKKELLDAILSTKFKSNIDTRFLEQFKWEHIASNYISDYETLRKEIL